MIRPSLAIGVRVAMTIVAALLVSAGCLRQDNTLNGRPLVAGMQLCERVPPDICQQQVAGLQGQSAGHGVLVGYRITCTSPQGCTRQSGEAEVAALYADGSIKGGGFAWEGPVPVP